ncbi:hypothetical protein HDF18_16185 [Mucilaginibacter sp. X5P1]|uniref:hypothetical protein n=1 Tax=Mucilaginibacter sp. X5P1 TaxID=2723088 RepID=UPI001610FEAC|nr:hypothetical protein [Mucilaginibacter sp. X5P1]MBB6139165.1 hypothetical protein [Mucilaginibacter sp. X5P1]
MIKHKQAKFLIIIIIGCICSMLAACGTMGQIGDSVRFSTSTAKLESALDSLYKNYPEYKMPATWAKYKSSIVRESPFTEDKFFYFKSNPEELYYVVLINDSVMTDDSARTRLAIRAVNRGSDKWILESGLDNDEEEAVIKRFDDEIVSKLRVYTKSKVLKEE